MTDDFTHKATVDLAVDKLRSAVPNAANIMLHAPERGTLVVSFNINGAQHGFRLKREAGLWAVREWFIDGKSQDRRPDHRRPSFDALISECLGALRRTPRISVIDLRCPDKHRQLFAKLIIQAQSDGHTPSNLIEVSCPWCKRQSGLVTLHYYNFDGRLVKTETREPYVKQEPGTWFRDDSDQILRTPSPVNNQPAQTPQEV